MKRTTSVRAAAVSAVAALALTGLGISAAFGAAVDPAQDHADVSSISADTGSLNIHKFTPTIGASTKGNGTEITNVATSLPGAKPIEGITFKAWKVTGINIKNNAAWEKIQGLAENFNNAATADAKKQVLADAGLGLDEVTPAALATNAAGATQFAALPVGFYYVEEVTPVADKTYKIHDGSEVKEVKGSQITPSLPFLVSVPLTNPDSRTEWLYDVHVYPKNAINDNEKSVYDEPTHGSGNAEDSSNLVYTIKTDLPVGVDNYASYKVVDPLDAKLSYVGDQTTSLDVVTVINKAGTKLQTFSTPDDYTITKSGTDNRTITLEFTAEGRAKLIDARTKNGAVKVQWELHARVGDTVGKTDIPNTAYQLPSNEANPQWDATDKPGNPTNEVVSKYGKVIITKVKEDGTTALPGAKFTLYVCDATGDLKTQVSVDGKSEWETSTSDGTIVIDGLRLNNWMNESPEKDGLINPATEYYCLKETAAPTGYELLPNPIRFQLLTTSTVETQEYTQGVKIKNVPTNGGPDLPITGGQGIILLVTAGGLLVAGSVAYTVAASRKRKQQA